MIHRQESMTQTARAFGYGPTGDTSQRSLPNTVIDAVIDHGAGRLQNICIERQYGVDAYREILCRDRALIASSLRDLGLPRLAFDRASAPKPSSRIRKCASVPLGPCRISWEQRYVPTSHPKPLRLAQDAPWLEQLLDWTAMMLRGRSRKLTRLIEALAECQTVCVWGALSPSVLRTLTQVPRARLISLSQDGTQSGLRVPMYSYGDLVQQRPALVVSNDSDVRPGSMVCDIARKLGVHHVLVAGTDPGTKRLRLIPVPTFQSPPAPSEWPRISVITVSFQQAEFLESCLRSVLDQGYPNLEYIVIDGGSTDGSRDILEKYRPHITSLVIEPDSGQSEALNKGLSRATGDLITWICSDDCLEPGSLYAAAAARSETGADLIAGGCRILDEHGRSEAIHHSGFLAGRMQPLSFGDLASFMGSWQKGLYFYQPELFFSRDIWNRSGGHVREHLYYAMDYEMFLRFALAGAQVYAVPDVLGCSRRHTRQKTRHEIPVYLPTVDRILQDFESDLLGVMSASCDPSAASSPDVTAMLETP